MFNFGDSLARHAYPALLLRRPRLIRFIHLWNSLVFQRNWVVRGTLRRLLPQLPPGSLVLDAGCGDGLHLFSFGKKFPRLTFWGVDKNAGHAAFCETLASQEQAGNLQFFHQNLEDLALFGEADLLLCVGTLQYVEDDRRVLENFCKALKTSGKLVLYVPVNGRTALPFYRRFFEKTNHYEKVQQRRRTCPPGEVFEKIAAAGLRVEERRFTYGSALGIAAHEAYSLLLMGLGNGGRWAWAFPLMAVPLMPLVLAAKALDFCLPKKDGNGLLVVAVKEAVDKG